MEIRSVDPRDTDREVDKPIYRVYFWEQLSYPGLTQGEAGYKSYENEVVGAVDVREILAWAEDYAVNRRWSVSVIHDGCEIWLLRDDPTLGFRS
jgi:hypothetical protein